MKKTINIFQVIKNRSRVVANDKVLNLYPNCIDSILQNTSKSNFKYRLFVYDFNSDDLPLEGWLPKKLDNRLEYKIISSTSNFFNKGEGLNFSRDLFVKDDFVVYLDADVMVTESFIKKIEDRFDSDKAVGFFAPFFFEEDGINGKKVLESVGNLWIRHKDLLKLPPWISMDCWGGEDTIFLYNCLKSGLKVIRETDVDLHHQWHPTDLRNKYYKGGKPPKDDYAKAIREYYKTGILREITK
jgi:hypothetical protein